MADDKYSDDPDYAKLDRRVMGLREQNLRFLHQLGQAGAAVDLSTARVEAAMQFLVDLGIITPMQLLEEQEKWELHLRTQLKPMHEEVMNAIRNRGGAVQQPSGLILPGKGARV